MQNLAIHEECYIDEERDDVEYYTTLVNVETGEETSLPFTPSLPIVYKVETESTMGTLWIDNCPEVRRTDVAARKLRAARG